MNPLLLFVLLFTNSFLLAQKKQFYENTYPKFVPYVVKQNIQVQNNTEIDIKNLGKDLPARWLSVDPLTDKFPGTSSYAYCFNNPLRNIDPDGKEPITLTITGVAVASVVTVAVVGHTYNYLTNPSYRRSYDSFTNSVINISSEAVANVWNTVSNWFSSDNSKNEGDVKEQSKEISKEIGKNSITLPDGTRVDLKGRGHTDKKTGEKVETPHTHEAKLHTNPKTGETFTKTKNTPRPTTQEDLDKIKEFIKKQNEER